MRQPARPDASRAAQGRAGADDPYKTFEKYGVVKMPDESEPPILTPATRAALAVWMMELNYSRELEAVGVKPRMRAMLEGPPGTGKTTLAHHIAARLGIPLVIIEISSLITGIVGSTGNNIGAVFSAARKLEGNVALFFDEIDSIGAARNSDGSSAGQERNNTVISLIQMLDRYDAMLFAATNRPEAIDAAIWRRFEMQITVGLPGTAERFAIVKRYLHPFDLPDEDVAALAAALEGAAPALIKNVIEQVKRELVLAPRTQAAADLPSILGRVIVSCQPAEDMPSPPLWSRTDRTLAELEALSWPPVLTKKAG
ncbi:ATP-binding protein [Caulobacter sp. CCNWLY153]|uniref:ATP-binding protein n=1 Tax=unclassified Caulobacter TaxID=2648921 RepID=UPI002FEF9586